MPDAIDLIIPAYNEQQSIATLLAAVPRQAFRHIIVVDNCSTDNTAQIARQAGVTVAYEPKRGYGSACLAGLRWIAEHEPKALPTAAAFVDADLSDDPQKLPMLIEQIAAGQADLVIGSRTKLAEPGALEPHQRFGNALACWLIRLATGRQYRDLGPMRVIRWTSLQTLAMQDRTWGWTVEMQFKAARRGLRVLEIDVPYRCRFAGKSKISGSMVGSARAGWRILYTVASLWLSERRHSRTLPNQIDR